MTGRQWLRRPGPRRRTAPDHAPVSPLLALLLLAIVIAGCADPPAPAAPRLTATATDTATGTPAATAASRATSPLATGTHPAPSTAQPTATQTLVAPANRGPFTMDEAHCGVLLPVIPPPDEGARSAASAAAPVDLQQIPEAARPAAEYMLDQPGSVALAAFEAGREAEGLYLNAGSPLPLASVIKVIHLIAYAQAVQEGALDPAAAVLLSELEAYYLPNSDLGAHPRAVAALREEGRVFGEPPAVLLEDVPRMMIEFSSNAAADYLHMLLGQERIEATILDLGLAQHTAPCPFLGQFLLLGNGGDSLAAVRALVEDPQRYSREVLQRTVSFSSDPAVREDTGGWFGRLRRPSLEAQQFFSENLNAHGSAGEYAALMARIASNDLGPWEQNVRIRRYLEWPTHFPANQESLAWVGYKGGSLPGVLTAVYYAQPWHTTRPLVVALFFHDLPLQTYRQWRRSLPNDELARWILREPQAIPLLRAWLE